MNPPEPGCVYGCPLALLRELFDDECERFQTWDSQQTMTFSEDAAPCAEAHWHVALHSDIRNFARQLVLR